MNIDLIVPSNDDALGPDYMKVKIILLVLALNGAPLARAQQSPLPELNPGDHVAIIGSAVADRFQHSGWLETYLYTRYPDFDLVFRNLAVPGDEVALRHRPAGFGSPDDWLTKVQADVIFAFFGFNESFQGKAGLGKFKADLDSFLKTTLAKNYSGKGHPRIVLFSPIANERTQDPNFPDPKANNANIQEYAAAMAQVARRNGVPFIDLFAPSQQLFAAAAKRGQSLTLNGLYLTEEGDQLLARSILRAFAGGPTLAGRAEVKALEDERLRAAVNEKNSQWEARYRTIDGNNVYGGRSALAYAPNKSAVSDRDAPAPYISNFKVMQEEMAQRDVLTANRDKRIWALARGRDLTIDDSNLPPVTPVPTDTPGPNPDGSFVYVKPEDSIAKMTVHSHMKVNLFASEEQFPELVNPVQMAWDTKGRLWVACWKNYPERTPTSKTGDSLVILEDTKGDGKADKITHFMDDLNAPTGFQFYKTGVLLMEAPDLWFVPDLNGNAGPIERVLMGIDSADSHHTANSLCLDPGGAIYLSDGVFHRTHVETALGPVRNNDGAIYRFEPRTGKFETYISYDFANPHGRVFDYWGNDLVTDATGNNNYFGPAFSGHIDYPAKHAEMDQFWDRPSRPCAGTGLLSSRQFPPEFQGDFLNCNVIGFQGIYLVKMTEQGSGQKGELQENLVSSSDPIFRPVAVNVGPDGAIYFCDWYKPLIGHMQHHLRDPNRDQDHGRIYRITYEGRPLLSQPRIDGQPIPALLDLLREPENRTRELAKIELGKHPTGEVIEAVNKWITTLDPKDPGHEHDMLEALWVYDWHNVVNTNLLLRLLHSPQPEARAAAGRVLCYWRDRVPEALGLFGILADDPNPRVRLEAVRDASFFRTADAAGVALTVLKHPTDYYIDYTLGETMRQLKPWVLAAIANHQPIAADNPAGINYLIGTLSSAELLKLPGTIPTLSALVERKDATDSDRLNALSELAKKTGIGRVAQLFALFGPTLDIDETAQVGFAHLLTWQPPDQLRTERARLAALALSARAPDVRQAAWAAMAIADNSFDTVWKEASQSPAAFADMLNGIPFVNDSDLRAKPCDRVLPLLSHAWEPPGNARGDFTDEGEREIRRAAIHALATMNHNPEAVFAALAALIGRGEEVPAAAQALRVLPPATWPRERAAAAEAALGLVAWAKTIPVNDRTSQDYIETVQLAGDLAASLGAPPSAGFQGDLRALRVPIFVIRTVREQMRYDTPRLVVTAGRPFEIRFENVDFMPHNLVIVRPGAREKVGLASAKMKPDELDDQGRAFIPESPDILAATKLIEPRQKTALKLTAPTEEGEYEYFCTYPGHYLIMWGQLIVTRNVDDYVQSHPQPALPSPASKFDNKATKYE
ncbi:MAG TPA: GDSL-type esterase/lipase family protein [Candidatus Baltobacteraceae bacterium]|jgi:azurin/glucose/arabinose dehydrogenase|nr:GDSL-type esterase/lipase family protein [Candidatus Baltobacteraceae bacterium]